MKCEMIVGHKDRNGEPGDEIYCQNEAVGIFPRVSDVLVCRSCAEAMLAEDADFGPLIPLEQTGCWR